MKDFNLIPHGPLGFEAVTGLGTAKGLTPPVAAKRIEFALIQAETADVRWRDDGTDPTATVGMLIAAGDTLVYTGNVRAIKFIDAVAGASLNVSYYS